MSESRTQHCTPAILESADTDRAALLTPVPLMAPPFNEAKLQELLAKYPSLLPVDELSYEHGPMICLGREVATKAGPLDLLYVSPSGNLSIVETKLWHNPEARRTVIGQIIDYTKEINAWSYEDLDTAVKKARCPGADGLSIFDRVRSIHPDLDETRFVDNVTRCLEDGRFLLIIAGNGIREGVQAMAEFLEPSLHFRLALVELGLFRMAEDQDWPLLVQPRIIARVQEVERAVVRVRAPGMEFDVEVPPNEEDTTSKTNGTKPRRILSENIFLSELRESTDDKTATGVRQLIKHARNMGLVTEWRAASVSLRIPDPGPINTNYTAIVIYTSGEFALGFLSYVRDSGGYDIEIAHRYVQRVIDLTGATRDAPSFANKCLASGTDRTPLTSLLPKTDEYLECLGTFLQELSDAADQQIAD
jgi:hypothetical protein